MILEEKCSIALARFFTKLEKDIHKIINKYWEFDLGYFHLNKISDLITLRKQEYYDILFKYCKIQYDKSRKRTKRIYDRQLEQMSIKSSISITTLSSLFKPDPAITYNLNNKIFTASHHTMNRVDNLVMNNLSNSYNEGLGIEEAKNNLTVKYNGLKGWEARRIARTEINSAQNDACFDMCSELGCEYIQWWTAQDERVRDGTKGSADHRKLHGKIVRIGTRFSNGLLYPGDREGSINEWINCRCTTIPFLIPLGKMVPPNLTEFTEDDLIDIPNWNTPTVKEILEGNYSTGFRTYGVKPPKKVETMEDFGSSFISRAKNLKKKVDYEIVDVENVEGLSVSERKFYNESKYLKSQGYLPEPRVNRFNELDSFVNNKNLKVKKIKGFDLSKKYSQHNGIVKEDYTVLKFDDYNFEIWVGEGCKLKNSLIRKVLERIPKGLLNQCDNKIIFSSSERVFAKHRNQRVSGFCDGKDNKIVIFDPEEDMMLSENAIKTISHECGHALDNNSGNWSSRKGDWTDYYDVASEEGGFVSDYAKKGYEKFNTEYAEDFAVAVELFVNNPNRLLKRFPNRFEFIKQVLFML